jgi:hypothetical protein
MIIIGKLRSSFEATPDILILGLCVLSMIFLFTIIFTVTNNFNKKLHSYSLGETTTPNRLGNAEIYGHESTMLGMSSEWLALRNSDL